MLKNSLEIRTFSLCGSKDSFFLQGDVDKDGYLDCAEFVAISVHLRKMGNEDHLRKAFQFFDKNETGYIEIEELRDAFADEPEATSEEVINAIIQDVDTDKVSNASVHVNDRSKLV